MCSLCNTQQPDNSVIGEKLEYLIQNSELSFGVTVRRYISVARGLYDLFYEKRSVILVSANKECIPIEVVLSCLIRILIDPFYRTIDGIIGLLRREWCTMKARHSWIHYFNLIACIYELVLTQPEQFQYTKDFVITLFNPTEKDLPYLVNEQSNITLIVKWKVSKFDCQVPRIIWSPVFLGHHPNLIETMNRVKRNEER